RLHHRHHRHVAFYDNGEQHFAFADAYRMMSNRIGLFANLPIHSLDQMALQQHLDDIGRDQVAAN
ncbi:hypothetical protein EN861_34340, partial [Mesorhizobium sp. M8A.F.Ca.ET.218.01.1.1]